MSIKHPTNKNLTLQSDKTYNGLSIQTHRGFVVAEYLDSIKSVIDRSLQAHPRTIAIRFDLRFPDQYPSPDGIPVITRFFKSLRALIDADLHRKKKHGIRVRDTDLRYVWAKEQGDAGKEHYHVAVFLNRDTYAHVGRYDSENDNMASRIRRAWASALGITVEYLGGAVYFPDNSTYKLNTRGGDGGSEYGKLFYRLSYLAKLDTKSYGDWKHSFGCSRK